MKAEGNMSSPKRRAITVILAASVMSAAIALTDGRAGAVAIPRGLSRVSESAFFIVTDAVSHIASSVMHAPGRSASRGAVEQRRVSGMGLGASWDGTIRDAAEVSCSTSPPSEFDSSLPAGDGPVVPFCPWPPKTR